MVFAPKLQSGAAFESPVQMPSALSAVSNLFDFGLKAAASSNTVPSLTEDEQFAVAVRDYESSKGLGFKWDNQNIREFVFQYPQFASQAKGFGEGIIPESAVEVSQDAVLDWAKTEEGILAGARASSMEPLEGEKFMMEQMLIFKDQEVKKRELERQTATLEAEGKLTVAQWDVLKPSAKSFTDNVVSQIVAPIITEVSRGSTYEVPPELKARFGIKYDNISIENLSSFINDVKLVLDNKFRSDYINNFGADTLPTEEWTNEALSSLKPFLEMSDQLDTPQEQAEWYAGLVKNELYKKLDDAGLAVSLELFKSLPKDSAELLAKELAATPALSSILAGSDGQLFKTFEDVSAAVAGLSTSEAKDAASGAVKLVEKGYRPEWFTAFTEASKRAGYDVVDNATFKAILGGNLPAIKKDLESNPEFRQTFSDWITADIQKTISIVRRGLPPEVSVVMQADGKFALTFVGPLPKRTTREVALMDDNEYRMKLVRDAQKAMPDGMNLDTLNEKVSSLGLLGDTGTQLQESLGIFNQDTKPTKTKESGGTRDRGRARGRDSGRVAKDVGEALGIDFLKYEQDNNLPEGYLNKVAMIESGGNPNAKNDNSSAGGLFQQIDSNAAAYGVSDRFDPVQSTEGAVRFAVENMNYLSKVLGRVPTGGELYLAHQQGPGGAARLLSNPDAMAVDIVGADAVRLNGGDENMTAGEFANIWISKYNGERGQTTYTPGERDTSIPVTNLRGETPSGTPGLNISPAEGLGASYEGLDVSRVQELVSMAKSAPEEAVRIAKEVLATKPTDPLIKSLIEAIVSMGAR